MPRVEVRIKVNPRARAIVKKQAMVVIRRVLRSIVAEMKRVLSTPYPPASRPGSPPHLRTGELRDSVRMECDDSRGEGAVFVDAEYAGYLESGTKRMRKRPFAMTTIRRVLKWFQSGYFTASRVDTSE